MTKKVLIILLVAICFGFTIEDKAEDKPVYSQEGFIGEVKLFAGNFAPRGWALCEGQLLAISSNTALFSILGTTYGGDGRTTFALPDLRGRVAIGPGTGPGLSTYRLGQRSGSETNTMLVNNIPAMTYGIPAYTAEEFRPGTIEKGTASILTTGHKSNETFKTTINGRSQSMNNMQPSLGMNYIICLYGTFPSRN